MPISGSESPSRASCAICLSWAVARRESPPCFCGQSLRWPAVRGRPARRNASMPVASSRSRSSTPHRRADPSALPRVLRRGVSDRPAALARRPAQPAACPAGGLPGDGWPVALCSGGCERGPPDMTLGRDALAEEYDHKHQGATPSTPGRAHLSRRSSARVSREREGVEMKIKEIFGLGYGRCDSQSGWGGHGWDDDGRGGHGWGSHGWGRWGHESSWGGWGGRGRC